MTENVLTPFEESPWFPCQLLKISDSRCNLEAAGPHRAAAPVVSLPLACRTEYSHWHGPSVFSCLSSSQLYVILCVCVCSLPSHCFQLQRSMTSRIIQAKCLTLILHDITVPSNPTIQTYPNISKRSNFMQLEH